MRYDALVAQWLAGGRSRTFGIDPAQVTMSELMLDYLEYCKKHYSAGLGSETTTIKYTLRFVAR